MSIQMSAIYTDKEEIFYIFKYFNTSCSSYSVLE